MRKVFAFAALTITTAAVCQERHKDQKVGTAYFRITTATDADAVMEPLMPTKFKMARLSGDGPIPNELQKCDVFMREVGIYEPGKKIFITTILKCGKQEFGISEVDFVVDGK